MQILQFFETIRSPLLTQAFLSISWLGNDALLLAGFCLVFWLLDRKTAYTLCAATFVCIAIGEMMNLYLTVSRPYILWPRLQPVAAARAAATGYAFPSSSTIKAVGAYGIISTFTSGWRQALVLLLPFLVALSRVYLGTNTAFQVMASIVIGLLFVWLVRKAGDALSDGQLSGLTVIASAVLTAIMLGAAGVTAPGSFNQSQALACFRTMGGIIGLILGAIIETRWIHFSSRAGWRLQAVKVLLGFGGVAVIYALSSQALNRWFGIIPGNVLRYALLLIWIVAGLPAIATVLRVHLEPVRQHLEPDCQHLEPDCPAAVPMAGISPESRS